MSYQGYYKRLPEGRYVCPACGSIYDGTFAKQQAKTCCADKKPLSIYPIKQAQEIMLANPKYPRPTPRTALPGDGVLHKDKWGHWRRLKAKKDKSAYKFTEYHKALYKVKVDYDKEICRRLDSLFPEWEPEDLLKHRKRTPLQRIAYGYYIRNFDLIKAAAYDLADEIARHRVSYMVKTGELNLPEAEDD